MLPSAQVGHATAVSTIGAAFMDAATNPHGLTRQAVADTLGMTLLAVARRISGKTPWQLPELLLFSQFLGVSELHMLRVYREIWRAALDGGPVAKAFWDGYGLNVG